MYYIYYIKIENTIRYIGITNNLKKRQYQHNYDCYTKLNNKKLYKKLREIKYPKIELTLFKNFKSKYEAELYECYLILKDRFTAGELWQEPPKKIRYF